MANRLPALEKALEARDAEAGLRELLASGNSLLVAGAGLSIEAGYKSWDKLLDHLERVAGELDPRFTPCADQTDQLARAEECKRSMGERRFEDEVGRLFTVRGDVDDLAALRLSGGAETEDLKPLHMALAGLPFGGFLTTNYDRVLEASIAATGDGGKPTPVSVWKGNRRECSRAIRALANGSARGHVIHLHGIVGQGPIVLAASDYEQAYGKPRELPNQLGWLTQGLLMMRRLVFVGFSLQDRYFAQLMERTTRLHWEWGEPIHYALLPLDPTGKAEQLTAARRLKEDLATQPVFYEYDEKSQDHSELERLVTRLAAPPSSDVRPSTPLSSGASGAVPQWASEMTALAIRRTIGDAD